MKTLEYKGIQINRCSSCYGLWFDKFELKDLQKLAGSEVVDMGDVDVGEEQNKNTRPKCPKCQKIMMPEIGNGRNPIQFERCTQCSGVYLDAGEFREFKKLSIIEYIKSLFNRD
ncbi:MAG: zf-TFIIB domain-containing protein [Candidatus Marinimicrobia bacterium]|nr:zf-TFIIB domain-containing protein [Candidatus Neomarinimicrobiota bacterium]